MEMSFLMAQSDNRRHFLLSPPVAPFNKWICKKIGENFCPPFGIRANHLEKSEARAAAIHLKPRPQAERHLTAGRQDYELEFLK